MEESFNELEVRLLRAVKTKGKYVEGRLVGERNVKTLYGSKPTNILHEAGLNTSNLDMLDSMTERGFIVEQEYESGKKRARRKLYNLTPKGDDELKNMKDKI